MTNHHLELPLLFNFAATFFFALNGALEALRREFDFIGVFSLAFVTGVGGALIRDGIFLQQGPPVIITNSIYLFAVFLASVIVLPFYRQLENITKRLLLLLDAAGLGIYGVVAVVLSFNTGLGPIACIFVGVVNGCSGGLLRDVLLNKEPLMFLPGQFYILASLAGCSLFTLLAFTLQIEDTLSAGIAIAVTFSLRILAIIFDWQTSALRYESNSRNKQT